MRTDKELFEWLEEERRKHALAFSVDYRKYLQRRIPKIVTTLLPILLIGFLILILLQHSRIDTLQENNTELSKEIDALRAQSDWYKSVYSESLSTNGTTAPAQSPPPPPQKYRHGSKDPFSLDYWQAS